MFHRCYRWRYGYGLAHATDSGCSTSLSERRNSFDDPVGSSRRSFYQSRRHRSSRHAGQDFGVRRPLRYLTYHLGLDDAQVRRIAAILDRLKTEREQAKLDEARTVTKVAALVTHPEVNVDLIKAALEPRVASAQQLQLAVARALQDIIVELDDEQREDLAYLLNAKGFVL